MYTQSLGCFRSRLFTRSPENLPEMNFELKASAFALLLLMLLLQVISALHALDHLLTGRVCHLRLISGAALTVGPSPLQGFGPPFNSVVGRASRARAEACI